MMKIMKNISIFVVATLLFAACSESSSNGETLNMREVVASQQQVEFQTLSTRVTDGCWDSADMIGVHMRLTDSSLASASIYQFNLNNRCYVASTSGDTTTSFVEATESDKLYYPQYDAVNFYAYAPYRSGYTYIYNVDLSSQSDPDAIDLLVSEPITERYVNSDVQQFSFTHRLSKLTIDFVPEGSAVIGNIDKLSASVSGVYQSGEYDTIAGTLSVSDTASKTTDLVLSQNSDGSVTGSAIMMPQNCLQNMMTLNVTIVVEGETVNFNTVELTPNMEAGKEYYYEANVTMMDVSLSASTSDPQITDWKVYKTDGETLTGTENNVGTLD